MAEYSPGVFCRIDFASTPNPVEGQVRWSPLKSLWWSGMVVGWAVLGTLYFSWSAVAAFVVLCMITLCLGHSIGMHRKLIHDAFTCPSWLEKVLVYLGTLVGLGGPFTMMYTHDTRDWAQRRRECHPFLSHQSPILVDYFWQIHCKFHLADPPQFHFPEKLTQSRFYRMLQATSMLQQIPVGIALYCIGDLGWVAWAVCGRVTVSIFGHWLVGFFAHNQGHRDWHVEGASVQGHNVPHLGLITFGECWHNNHHAFPGSAKLGLNADQFDPGWHVLQALQAVGLVSELKQPSDMAERPELQRFAAPETGKVAAARPAC
ncbi:MAG: acyl-CoA desaturase [Pseudomonadota bacterium]